MFKRPPDKIIGEDHDPYLLRWHLIPRNKFFNIYLHKFMRSDDDRALHDHPWSWNISLLIKGAYIEHMLENVKTYGKVVRNFFNPGVADKDFRTTTKTRRAWRPVFRRGTTPHRIELFKKNTWIPLENIATGRHEEWPTWSLFITGSHVREWGFYCPQGWRHWEAFVSKRPGGNHVGKGCE